MTERRLIRFCKHCGQDTVNPSSEECGGCGGPLVQQTSLGEHA